MRVSYSKYRMVPEDVIWDDTDDDEDEDLYRVSFKTNLLSIIISEVFFI